MFLAWMQYVFKKEVVRFKHGGSTFSRWRQYVLNTDAVRSQERQYVLNMDAVRSQDGGSTFLT
jgi:hypothetical protein